MKEIRIEVDDEFWDILTQLKEFKGQKEIVQCKDCKYWTDGTCEMLGTVHMNADDFCSRGEKR